MGSGAKSYIYEEGLPNIFLNRSSLFIPGMGSGAKSYIYEEGLPNIFLNRSSLFIPGIYH